MNNPLAGGNPPLPASSPPPPNPLQIRLTCATLIEQKSINGRLNMSTGRCLSKW